MSMINTNFSAPGYWSAPNNTNPNPYVTTNYANPIYPPKTGCWVVHSSDDDIEIYVFETELSALRFAFSNKAKYKVKFVVFGKPLLPMIDS